MVLPFSRGNESDADEIGLVFTAKAGYDPREAPGIWQRMHQASGGSVPTFLSSHPSDETRERALRQQLAKVLPLYDQSERIGVGERWN
jgi:predicted Zn-dependent protease